MDSRQEKKLDQNALAVIESLIPPFYDLAQGLQQTETADANRLLIIKTLLQDLTHLHTQVKTNQYLSPALAVREAIGLIRIAREDIRFTFSGERSHAFLLLTKILSAESLTDYLYLVAKKNLDDDNIKSIASTINDICINLMRKYVGKDNATRINKIYELLYKEDSTGNKVLAAVNLARKHFQAKDFLNDPIDYPDDERKFYFYLKNLNIPALLKLKQETAIDVEVVKLPKPTISPHRDDDL